MKEQQQKNHLSSVSENKVEKPEVSNVEEAKMPSIEDLDAILKESENVAIVASMSEKEIDEMIECWQKSLYSLQEIDLIQRSRLRRVENFNPLKDLKSSDYDRLVQEEIIDPEYAERFKKIDELITKLESLDYPSADAKVELEKLSGVRNAFREKLESQIKERQQEIIARREEVKNKLLEHYAKRTEELVKIIKEIESNPHVVERLKNIAEQKQRAFQEKIEQERKKIIQEITRCVQSLSMRHDNAFKRISDLTGNEKVIDELMEAFSSGDERRQQAVFDKTRSRLINAIIDGEGEKQLKDPKEIVPWKVAPTTIQYVDAINFLRFHETKKALQSAFEAGNEQIKKLMEQCEQIITGNEIFRKLFGPQWITDRKTNKKRMGVFWAAFETRKKNDKEGITAARKKEREEAIKRKALFKKEAEDIISRGGFVVEFPVIKEIRGKREIVGKRKGVVRLEKRKSKKGNDYWKVVEILGITEDLLKLGAVSTPDMRSFPHWLRESAEPYFLLRGKDFIDRLNYEKKE